MYISTVYQFSSILKIHNEYQYAGSAYGTVAYMYCT